MPLKARQITLAASIITPLLVKGTTGTKFLNIQGTVTDPVPVQIKNEDAMATVWIGGPDVSATNGQSMGPGDIKTMNLNGESEIPYAFSTGTPIISLLLGRQ